MTDRNHLDDEWSSRVTQLVGTMIRPLVKDGGHYAVVATDPEAHTVTVGADPGDCDTCAMTDEDLAALLEEGARRAVDPLTTVKVVPYAEVTA
jgi:Fe-S cluster biogenesis protein NfuA